jgi:hypothetical protein
VPVAVNASLSGLEAGTSYSVTLVATTAQGTSTGHAVTFTTQAATSGPPLQLSGLVAVAR